MTLYAFAALVSATAALVLAPAASTMTPGPDSVQGTKERLEANGHAVIVNRIGNGTSDECTVSAIRPGQTTTRVDSGVAGAGTDLTTTLVRSTVYLEIRC